MVISLPSGADFLGNHHYICIFYKLLLFPFLHHIFQLLFLDFLFLALETPLQKSMFSNHPTHKTWICGIPCQSLSLSQVLLCSEVLQIRFQFFFVMQDSPEDQKQSIWCVHVLLTTVVVWRPTCN